MSDSLRDALEELHRLDDSVPGYQVCDADEQTWPCETARLLAAHPVEPAGVSDEAVEAVAHVRAEHYEYDVTAEKWQDFLAEARAALEAAQPFMGAS